VWKGIIYLLPLDGFSKIWAGGEDGGGGEFSAFFLHFIKFSLS
jgi:hypothetical protein